MPGNGQSMTSFNFVFRIEPNGCLRNRLRSFDPINLEPFWHPSSISGEAHYFTSVFPSLLILYHVGPTSTNIHQHQLAVLPESYYDPHYKSTDFAEPNAKRHSIFFSLIQHPALPSISSFQFWPIINHLPLVNPSAARFTGKASSKC